MQTTLSAVNSVTTCNICLWRYDLVLLLTK
jgi:hypothetical protein